MPALRLATRRRRSSHAIFTPAKAGIYGIPQRPVTFAPNVTPITFTEVDPEDDPTNPLSSYALAAAMGNPSATGLHLTSKLFPPSETPAPPPTRKRCPPGKRRSQGYIPRPPNAFMLFRADFVRQKHVPGSIETNHGSLSKIIGTCWRQLPLEEKRVWEVKAKQEKAAHKAMFPDYRFRPVHNKNKLLVNNSSSSNSSAANATSSASTSERDDSASKRKEKQPTTADDERRCDQVAQLLLEGKKGEELARAVRHLDRARSLEREREMEMEMMDEYELEMGEQQEEQSEAAHSQTQAQALHMPVSQHAHGFGMGGAGNMYPSFMHNGSGVGMSIPPHMQLHAHNNSIYHRRSSSVPLPNEWQPYSFSHSQNFPFSTMNASGIAIPTIPQFSRPESPVGSITRFNQSFPYQQGHTLEQFTNPFESAQNTSNSTTSTSTTGEYQFAPIPEFTPAAASFFGAPPLFHPVPQHAASSLHHHSHSLQENQQQQHGYGQPLLPFMTQTTPRSSLGLGQRRASSAQGVLMRSWTMPMGAAEYDYTSMDMGMGMGYAGMGVVERDPSPLPDVESGLFSDFSFGGKLEDASSAASSLSATESAAGSSSASSQSQNQNQHEDSKPSRAHELGLDIAIPPTSTLSRIDTSVSASASFADYSPTQVPPSSISTSSSEGNSPASAPGGLPETPATAGMPFMTPSAGGAHLTEHEHAHAHATDSAKSAGRMDSLDLSAFMHLDGLYAPDAASASASALGAVYAHEQGPYPAHEQGYAGMGYYAYDEGGAGVQGGEGAYYEASA